MGRDRRVALVTGAGRGIGLAIALKLAADGLDLVLNDLDKEPLAEASELASGIGAEVVSVLGSVSQSDFPAPFYDAAIGSFGRIDVVVNNAGYATYGKVEDLPTDDWDRVLDVLISAPFRILQPIGRYFRETAPMPRMSRRVINISSIAGISAGVNQPAYGAGKAAIINLTNTLAQEWGPYNVRANAVLPGIVRTRLTEAIRGEEIDIDGQKVALTGMPVDQLSSTIPVGRAARPDDIAGAVSLLIRPEADYINGHSLVVDGGFRRGATR